MRLNLAEQNAIKVALAESLLPFQISYQSYLFGSRVNSSAKGGDIDLLILIKLPKDELYKISKSIELKFTMQIEEKIDVLVLNPDNLTTAEKLFIESLNLLPIDY